jgi:DNA-3-methyladenine glycosylase I
VARLMENAGIIRNRAKIESAIGNARAFLDIQKEYGSFDAFLWSYVDGEPLVRRPRSVAAVPAMSPLSDRLSKDLRKRGFRFVGSTICYAYLQAVGVVNDHLASCFKSPK